MSRVVQAGEAMVPVGVVMTALMLVVAFAVKDTPMVMGRLYMAVGIAMATIAIAVTVEWFDRGEE